jgi:hypothetical protein
LQTLQQHQHFGKQWMAVDQRHTRLLSKLFPTFHCVPRLRSSASSSASWERPWTLLGKWVQKKSHGKQIRSSRRHSTHHSSANWLQSEPDCHVSNTDFWFWRLHPPKDEP